MTIYAIIRGSCITEWNENCPHQYIAMFKFSEGLLMLSMQLDFENIPFFNGMLITYIPW